MVNNIELINQFREVANNPLGYAKHWKEKHNRPVVGILPMNFPGELVHAAGALPIILQEDDQPVTVGSSRIFSFYCGYNRSLVNQTVSDEFSFLDAIMLGDHCVQILGTADVMRNHMPNVPVLYDQLVATINSSWAFSESRRVLGELKAQLEQVLGVEISNQQLNESIKLFNKSRQLMRDLYELRRTGKVSLSSIDVMAIVQSSMVMDRQEHVELLEEFLRNLDCREVDYGDTDYGDKVPVYLSGHMCHAPKSDLLELIEECGAVVVGDDLYTGYRFIAADAEPAEDALDSLTNWYLDRNKKVPCPTRSAREYDWNEYLVDAVKASQAQGVIILLVKFCEPHMYYYPDIKHSFDENQIPHLLIETEHEGMAMESVKTRLETFIEVANRRVLV